MTNLEVKVVNQHQDHNQEEVVENRDLETGIKRGEKVVIQIETARAQLKEVDLQTTSPAWDVALKTTLRPHVPDIPHFVEKDVKIVLYIMLQLNVTKEEEITKAPKEAPKEAEILEKLTKLPEEWTIWLSKKKQLYQYSQKMLPVCHLQTIFLEKIDKYILQ